MPGKIKNWWFMNTLSTKILVIVLLLINSWGFTQFHVTHKDEFLEAEKFYIENKESFDENAKKVNLSGKFLFSIVAPEISQFNTLSNAIEIYGLKVLYVQNGKSYADFSIGYFQMKPSFVEAVEDRLMNSPKLKKKYKSLTFLDGNSRVARLNRVERLETIEFQLEYLCAFCDIVNEKFHDTSFKNEKEKLAFYAAAYNSGFNHSLEYLKEIQSKQFFPRFSSTQYNYSEVSILFL